MTWRLALVVAIAAALAATACTRTAVDSDATGIEIATLIDAADAVTQLQIAGTADGADVFAPGVVPSVPRALSGEQTADVLLSPALDGTEMLVRVDALAGSAIVHTGGGMVTVHANELVDVNVELGAPAICGDGIVVAPFETCDTGNTIGSDGCSATCQVEPGWSCVGMPSQCTPQNSNKEITSFAFLAVANPGLSSDVLATINGTTISATVPFGTDVSALVATFAMTGASASVAGAPQVSGETPNDFAAPVTYTIVAADNSTKTYTVSVGVASNSDKDLTSFEFLAATNAALGVDVVATINGTTIAATVPNGTDVGALVASFNTTGASVAVNGIAQTSGVTPNSFAHPVAYTVTAADASTKVYTVTVTVAPGSAKEITSFKFLSANNPTLAMDVTATINGTTIAATVPSGTNVTALVASFATTGESVAISGVVQTSGTTADNFANPVAYTVTAADGSTQVFTVTVTVAPSSAKTITSYAFLTTSNPNLGANVVATINGTTISATVPFGTNVTALVATFASTGASVTVGGVAQTSGATSNDFTSSVEYIVTADDSTMQTYTVNVTVAPSSEKTITSYAFLSANNAGLGDVAATIDGTTITATVPSGTDVTALIATFATTGVSVTVGGVVQASGQTPNDFTSAVAYTVTAADNSTQIYTVTVTIAPSSAKAITSFAFLSVDNSPNLSADVTATITGTSITATVPNGTDVTALIATFASSGASVNIGGVAQASGETPNDFTSPVTYTVVAADGSTQDFTVTVSIAPSSSNDITAYAFPSSENGNTLMNDAIGSVNGTQIAVTVPTGTDVTALVAEFTTTGQSVSVNGTIQVSGATANDFTNPVTYTVTAADTSTQAYTVTVTFD